MKNNIKHTLFTNLQKDWIDIRYFRDESMEFHIYIVNGECLSVEENIGDIKHGLVYNSMERKYVRYLYGNSTGDMHTDHTAIANRYTKFIH